MPGTERPPSSAAVSVGPEIAISHAMTNIGTGSSSGFAVAKVCPACGVHYPAEFKVCPKDATELAELENDMERDELVGKTLGQSYTIVRVIGEGGMGRVYEARHTRIGGKRFAVKLLHPEYARQPEVISRFQREAEAAAAIRSPYVVDVYDVDRTADGRPFIVGEFLQGKEFATYLDETGKMPVGPAVRVVRQICKALASAHEKGVVHRDMKPENVFLTGDMTRPIAKVIDFGISKVSDAETTMGAPSSELGAASKRKRTALTKTGMIMGTPSYMAPEQARGERVDHRADIYAVGAILYCALTGQRPFDRGDPTATITAVLTQDPPRPRSLEMSIPEPLELVIQRAMARRLEDRYQTMADLDGDLAAWDPGEGDGPMMLRPASSSLANAQRSGSLHQQTRAVAMARPMIVLLGGLGLFWTAGSLLTFLTGAIRVARGGGATANLNGTEAILMIAGVFFAAVTPLAIAARWLSRTVWNNSVTAMGLSEILRRPVLVGLSAYGFGSLLVRVLESVVLRHAVGVAWPVWDLLLFFAGVVAAGGAYAFGAAEKKQG